MKRIATCCCGQASIEVEGDPVIHVVCHCSNCQQRTGSAFGVSAYFDNSQVIQKTGRMQVYEINNEETEQKRFFCPDCGTTLYWQMSRFPRIPGVDRLTGVAGGCFTENPLPKPVFSASNDNKCAWIELPGIKTV